VTYPTQTAAPDAAIGDAAKDAAGVETFTLLPETPAAAPAIEALLDDVFGADRFGRVSYRYRVDVPPVVGLSWTAYEGQRLVGTIRYWPVTLGGGAMPALLLGPLGIARDRAGRGVGRRLMRHTLELAGEQGYGLVLLVGDPAYYQRFGFLPATPHGFLMPGEPRPEKLQMIALRPGALAAAKALHDAKGIVTIGRCQSGGQPLLP